ncbi:MAG: hypothetical protein ABI388_12715 [Bacteroidia bacterium]
MKKIIANSILLSLSILLMTSCGGNGNENERKDELKDSTAVAETVKTVDENSDEKSYTLPSPMQIATILKKSGLKYYGGLTNPIENSSKYRTGKTISKTLGMGTYLADLSYCILNKQTQETKNYFKTCTQLAETIGLAKAFQTKGVPSRMEKNIGNQDSVFKMLSEIQIETDNLLEENQQNYISVIVFTGAWVETMYIGTQVYSKEKNSNVVSNLVEQMGVAENIIKALQATASKDVDVTGLLQDMNALNDMYNNFKSVKEIKATDPDIIDPSKLTISAEELQSFSKKIEEIRTRIIQG